MVKHIFDRYFLFPEPPEIRTVEGLSAIFAFVRCEDRLCSQTYREYFFRSFMNSIRSRAEEIVLTELVYE